MIVSSYTYDDPTTTYILILFLLCIPKIINTNISHQLFDYTITFVNSALEQDSKGDFVLKTRF